MLIEAGFAKTDITAFEEDMVMLGWGQAHNRFAGVHTPLHARAVVLKQGERSMAIVTAELAFISVAVRQGVLERLDVPGLDPHSVLITATHSHSGPSGFSHFLAYNAVNYGYSPRVYRTIVDGIVAAVVAADARRAPARMSVGAATIPIGEPVAFNRSVNAYNANLDVARVDPRRPEVATHRETVTLRVDAADGRPLGAINWFGVHATSLHSDNDQMHPDNKGLAAARFESEMGGDFVAIFQQEAAGDVSPNFRFVRERGFVIGSEDDDFSSAERNADIQYRYARRAHQVAGEAPPLEGPLFGSVQHVDMTRFATDEGGLTRPPAMALGMAAGTTEGPGPLRPVARVLRALSGTRRALGQRDNLLPWISVDKGADGRFLGFIPMRLGFEIVAPLEPMIAFVRAADRAGYVGDLPWVPSIVPVQLIRLGGLVIAALPTEPTTVAGRRLRLALQRVLQPTGVQRVVIAPYANGYSGYLTTPHEYQAQHYEGAATYFGPSSLDAYRAVLLGLAARGAPELGESVPGPHLEWVDEDFLIRQRIAGRAGVSGPGSSQDWPL